MIKRYLMKRSIRQVLKEIENYDCWEYFLCHRFKGKIYGKAILKEVYKHKTIPFTTTEQVWFGSRKERIEVLKKLLKEL